MRIFVSGIAFCLAFGLFSLTLCSAQSAAEKAKVAAFVGGWGGYGSVGTSISGNVQLQSKFIKTNVVAVKDGIEIKSEVQAMTCSIVADAKLGKYVLSFSADGFPAFKGLPLSYSDSGEFSGTLAYSVDGQAYTATATIKRTGSDPNPEVEVEATRGKDRWWMRFPFAKEK